MPAPEPIYEPINGLEAREIIKRAIDRKVEKIPYLYVGNAFHRLEMDIAIVFRAFPADCPVPEAEFNIVIEPPDIAKGLEKFKVAKEKVDYLNNEKKKAEAIINKLNVLLETINPTQEIVESLKAGDTPDELRESFSLPTPAIVTTRTGAKVETSIFRNRKVIK